MFGISFSLYFMKLQTVLSKMAKGTILRSVIKRPTDGTTGQTDTTSVQTSTTNGQANGQRGTTSGKTSTTSG